MGGAAPEGDVSNRYLRCKVTTGMGPHRHVLEISDARQPERGDRRIRALRGPCHVPSSRAGSWPRDHGPARLCCFCVMCLTHIPSRRTGKSAVCNARICRLQESCPHALNSAPPPDLPTSRTPQMASVAACQGYNYRAVAGLHATFCKTTSRVRTLKQKLVAAHRDVYSNINADAVCRQTSALDGIKRVIHNTANVCLCISGLACPCEAGLVQVIGNLNGDGD